METNKDSRAVLQSFLGIVAAVVAVVTGGCQAYAAPLSYLSNTNLNLPTPSTTFIIVSGSSADSLTVNATSVALTLSSSTSGTFTLTSASSGISIATSSVGGTVSVSCTSGLASTTISQSTGSTTYTITPTGSPCVPVSAPTLTPGVSVGVPSAYGIPNYGSISNIPNSTTTATASIAASSSVPTASPSSLADELKALQAQLAALQVQADQSAAGSPRHIVFTRNLYFGITGNDVKALQLFLVAQNSGPAAGKLARHGPTKNFAILTLNALREFQVKAGIHPAIGYFGPITRAYVNAIEEKSATGNHL